MSDSHISEEGLTLFIDRCIEKAYRERLALPGLPLASVITCNDILDIIQDIFQIDSNRLEELIRAAYNRRSKEGL